MAAKKAQNILFIMFDQLRWDYLSCYGHPHLQTPHIDALATKGVRFNRAFIQSPLCGPSRMSTYTGRYVHSHGASWNNVPLKVGELTLGDHLRDLGMDCSLVGKTHMKADAEGMHRLGLAPDSVIGARVAECGFDIFERDDGMRPEGPAGLYDEAGSKKYNEYLSEQGYKGDNPWHDHANSGIDDTGNVLSGWFLNNSDEQANIDEQDSETPYLTRRGIEFIEAQGDKPWCCHLSYIKPHWPYIVPAPYHNMYGPEHILPVVRTQEEYDKAHPVFKGFMNSPVGKAFARDDVREKVIKSYMGLIKQCDDQMGVLFEWLEKTGRMDDTMIVLTSDHGDFLGDHWLGEKNFFQDASIRIPLIIYDPSTAADSTRGSVVEDQVESIDIVPTLIDVSGGNSKALDHILEGKSLLPLLHGVQQGPLRDYVICEYDYSSVPLADKLGLNAVDARMLMIANQQWKLIHFEGGYRPMLFDLVNDPNELVDLAEKEDSKETIDLMYEKLFEWTRRLSQRTTMSNQAFKDYRKSPSNTKGVLIGVVDEHDISAELTEKYVGRKVKDYRSRE